MPSTVEKSTRGSHLSLMFEAGMLFAMLDLMSIKINGSQLAKMKKSILTCPCHKIYRIE